MSTPEKPESWFARARGTLYPLFNVGMLLAVLGGMVFHGAELGAAVYVVVLIAICSTPMLFMRGLNDRYALLGVFMALYFLFFGALDLSTLLMGSEIPEKRENFMSSAEIAILLGGLLVFAGYMTGLRLGAREGSGAPPAEWPDGIMLFLGLTLWLAGTASILYFQVFSAPEKTDLSVHAAFATMGPLLTFAVMLGNMLQPLGVLLLAYGYARRRGTFWLTLVLAVVALHIFVGFVTDVKRIALMGAALVVLTRIMVDNKLPKVWIIGSIVGIALTFPIFQAYRAEVEGNRGLDRLQAFQELGHVLEITLAASSKESSQTGIPGEHAQSFIERSSLKGPLSVVFDHVESGDVPLLNGSSLVALPMAFVPRLLAPDKADISVGQLFTRRIAREDADTYISISHLGELYWNFGWPGILLGMPLCGLLLGFVGAKFNLEGGTSATRILVLLVTIQCLCIGFEGTVPTSYVLWLRSMAAIGLLHLVCARAVRVGTGATALAIQPAPAEADRSLGSTGPMLPAQAPAKLTSRPARPDQRAAELPSSPPGRLLLPPAPRFPNIMR